MDISVGRCIGRKYMTYQGIKKKQVFITYLVLSLPRLRAAAQLEAMQSTTRSLKRPSPSHLDPTRSKSFICPDFYGFSLADLCHMVSYRSVIGALHFFTIGIIKQNYSPVKYSSNEIDIYGVFLSSFNPLICFILFLQRVNDQQIKEILF